jgi:hypothetical protein
MRFKIGIGESDVEGGLLVNGSCNRLQSYKIKHLLCFFFGAGGSSAATMASRKVSIYDSR